MRSFRDINPYVVGVISVVLLMSSVAAAFAVGFLNLLDDTYEMHGVFSDASGLKEGDRVKLAGVNVGRVTDIDVDRAAGEVRVDWVVDKGVDIGRGAGAEIALASLLGARHIRIVNPMAGAGDGLMEELPKELRRVEHTAVPYDIFDLTRQATDGINELETDDLNQLLVDLADITEDKGATVEDLTTGIARVSRAVTSRDEQFGDLLAQIDRLGETLSNRDEELLALIDSSAAILDLIIERRNDLAIVLGESATAVRELDWFISDNKEALDSLLDSLAPTLDMVDRNMDDINRGLAWLGPGLLQQSKGGGQGPWGDIFVASLGPADSEMLGDLVAVIDSLVPGLLGGEGP